MVCQLSRYCVLCRELSRALLFYQNNLGIKEGFQKHEKKFVFILIGIFPMKIFPITLMP